MTFRRRRGPAQQPRQSLKVKGVAEAAFGSENRTLAELEGHRILWSLIRRMTRRKRHAETHWGGAMGKEVW